LSLDPPQRDDDGEVIPHDHGGILPDDGVIRRVSPHHFVYDAKIQGKRLSSMAFKPSTGERGGMSVDLQRLIEEAGLNPKTYIMSPPWIGAVRFTAGELRAEGLKVGYDPVADNPYHGQVWGTFSKQTQKRLAALASEFVPILERGEEQAR
jgi:hypothetical protein